MASSLGPGFWYHGTYGGTKFTPLALPQFDDPTNYLLGALDVMVSDLGAGVNGWTTHDDQRRGGTGGGGGDPSDWTYFPTSWTTAGPGGTSTTGTLSITGGAAALSASQSLFNTYMVPNSRAITYGGTPFATSLKSDITPAAQTWQLVQSIGSNQAATMAVNWPYASLSGARKVYEQTWGYVVFKCTSQLVAGDRAAGGYNFYVKVSRLISYGYLFAVQVYEYWNKTAGAVTYNGVSIPAHTGYRGGTVERIRVYKNAYAQTPTSTTTVQTAYWFLPDTFALWGAGDPGVTANVFVGDLFYASNLIAFRSGDKYALVSGCSEQAMTSAYAATSASATNTAWGCFQCLQTLGGTVWSDGPGTSIVAPQTTYVFAPRGRSYIESGSNGILDPNGIAHFVPADAYQAGATSSIGAINEGKRGEFRYIRIPAFNPTGLALSVFGPADDGNTYVLLKLSSPGQPTITEVNTTVDTGIAGSSQFPGYGMFSNAGGRFDTVGDIQGSGMGWAANYRYIALPINL